MTSHKHEKRFLLFLSTLTIFISLSDYRVNSLCFNDGRIPHSPIYTNVNCDPYSQRRDPYNPSSGWRSGPPPSSYPGYGSSSYPGYGSGYSYDHRRTGSSYPPPGYDPSRSQYPYPPSGSRYPPSYTPPYQRPSQYPYSQGQYPYGRVTPFQTALYGSQYYSQYPSRDPYGHPHHHHHPHHQDPYHDPYGRPPIMREASVTMKGRPGTPVDGTIEFCQQDVNGVRVKGKVTGLPGPGSHHGLHILMDKECPPMDQFPIDSKHLTHYDPFNSQSHGHRDSPQKHVGDLGNIYVAFDGVATFDFLARDLTLDDPTFTIANHSIVITEREDDNGRNPNDPESRRNGNSGKAIACGVIRLRNPVPNPFGPPPGQPYGPPPFDPYGPPLPPPPPPSHYWK